MKYKLRFKSAKRYTLKDNLKYGWDYIIKYETFIWKLALEKVNNLSILNSENFDALNTLRINRSRSLNLATCALRDSLVHQQWHSPSSWNIKRDFYSDVYTILRYILTRRNTICLKFKIQTELCPTLSLWGKLIYTIKLKLFSFKNDQILSLLSSMFTHKLFKMLLHWHTFFNMCHTLKTRLNT